MNIVKVLDYPSTLAPNTLYLKSLGGGKFEASLSNVTGTELAVMTAEASGPSLNALLVYYGYPIAYKALWDTTAVIADISTNFKYWVVGDTYQDPAHEEYATTTAIIAGVRANGVKVYGYVPTGQNTQGLSLAQIETRIDQWDTLGVDGIFLDEFGFDYENSRSKQISIVNYVHGKGLPYTANAWTYADVMFDDIADVSFPSNDWRYINFTTYNPTNLVLPRNPTDAYMVENFCFDHQGPANKWDCQERSEIVRDAAVLVDMKVWALAVIGEESPGVMDAGLIGSFTTLEEVGAYIAANAYLYDFNIVGSGGYSFGAGGTPIWAPLPALPLTAGAADTPASNNYTTNLFRRFFGPVEVVVLNDAFSQHVTVVGDEGSYLSGEYPIPASDLEELQDRTTALELSIGDIAAALALINGE